MIDLVLDTSIVIELLRQNHETIQWYGLLGKQRAAITPIVWFETLEGARNKIEQAQIVRFLKRFYIEHTSRDDHQWAMLQYGRYQLSHGVEWADVLIASVAVRLNVPLYTLNIKHYAALPQLDPRRPY